MTQSPPVLLCKCCQKAASNVPLNLAKLAAFGGYGCVEWTDPGSQVPEGDVWQRSSCPPKVGTKRRVLLGYPGQFTSPDGTWLIFRPAYSTLDGWLDHPDELPLSGLARCHWLETMRNDGHRAWVEVEVVEYIPMTSIQESAPPSLGDLPMRFFEPKPFLARKDEWTYYSWSAQGDLGEWAIFRLFDSSIKLLLYGEWGFDYESFSVLNLQLNEGRFAELVSKTRVYPH